LIQDSALNIYWSLFCSVPCYCYRIWFFPVEAHLRVVEIDRSSPFNIFFKQAVFPVFIYNCWTTWNLDCNKTELGQEPFCLTLLYISTCLIPGPRLPSVFVITRYYECCDFTVIQISGSCMISSFITVQVLHAFNKKFTRFFFTDNR